MQKRHIQDWTIDAEVEPHWGYADRQVPCTSDRGACLYLDEVYGAHDRGMIYMGIIWLTFAAILVAWGVSRLVWSQRNEKQCGLGRISQAVRSTVRRYLLADCIRIIFGRTTRLQVLILGVLTAYLTFWTFIGITYTTWMSPVAQMPGVYSARTSIGPWADRIGVIAYALTPLSVLLSSRESLLSLITGVPYQHFNFLHRWLGYIILVQSSLHTIGWCIVEIRLYQPQPETAISWINQLYIIWGVVAMGLLLVLYVFTLPFVIRRTGYEFFRKSHYVLAMVYIGACIGHWKKLHCFLTPSIILWGIDRLVRLVRTWLIHRRALDDNGGLFNPAEAAVTLFPNSIDGDIVRLDFKHRHKPWSVGQHFYVCFSEGSIWQSHPFTPLNLPELASDGRTAHSYIFRAKQGETKKVATMLAEKQKKTTPVILSGPYGGNMSKCFGTSENVLCVAGGTGITYVLPVIFAMSRVSNVSRKVELVWFVRYHGDVNWIRPELDALEAQDMAVDMRIRIFTTRDKDDDDRTDSSYSDEKEYSSEEKNDVALQRQKKLITIHPSASAVTTRHSQHPDVRPIVEGFVDGTVAGSTSVYASGPGPMMSDLREAIAACNSGGKVWKGQQKYNVSLTCDERLEH